MGAQLRRLRWVISVSGFGSFWQLSTLGGEGACVDSKYEDQDESAANRRLRQRGKNMFHKNDFSSKGACDHANQRPEPGPYE